jgi:hypothetical protein
MIRRLTLLVLSAMLLGACVPKPLLLKPSATEKITSVDQVLIVPQNNLDVTINPGNGAGGAIFGVLIVAVIDESRRASAKEEGEPIIDELRGYDFRAVMLEAMNSEAKSSS